VWVAGNVANVMAQVVSSAAAGLAAGAAINADLIAEDARGALDRHRRAADSADRGLSEPSRMMSP
jgi:thioredoxin reductase (NADPH)